MDHRRILGAFWIFFLSILSFSVQGQEQFYAKTDARDVLVNSYFEVQFVLENASGSDFVPPDFSPFTVVSGPSTSNRIPVSGETGRWSW